MEWCVSHPAALKLQLLPRLFAFDPFHLLLPWGVFTTCLYPNNQFSVGESPLHFELEEHFLRVRPGSNQSNFWRAALWLQLLVGCLVD